jgi:hypothetical protein
VRGGTDFQIVIRTRDPKLFEKDVVEVLGVVLSRVDNKKLYIPLLTLFDYR